MRSARHQAHAGILPGLFDDGSLTDVQGHPVAGADDHFGHMSQQTETGDVGAGMHGKIRHHLCGLTVQRCHQRGDRFDDFGSGNAALDGGVDDTDPQGLGKDQSVPGDQSLFGEHPVRVDEAGHRQSVLQLIVLDAVAAHQHHPAFL